MAKSARKPRTPSRSGTKSRRADGAAPATGKDDATVASTLAAMEVSAARVEPSKASTRKRSGARKRRSVPESDVTADLALPPRYRLLGTLGRGGMGAVYRVYDTELERTAALKLLADHRQGPAFHIEFHREARIAARLGHPGIVPVFEIGSLPDGRPYYVMQEIRGETLTAAIERAHASGDDDEQPGELRVATLLGAFRRVCDTVAYAHLHGVIHRDLKPANIMVGTTGEVYVVDWGLAKALVDVEPQLDRETETVGPTETRLGTVKGTLLYMSPEQARGDARAIDERSDVWALGIILYQILCGRTPHDSADPTTLLQRIPTARISLSRASGRFVDEELQRVCERALALAPDERYPTARQLATELGDYLEGRGRRSRAAQLVADARALAEESRLLEHRADALASEARALLEPLAPWAPERDKIPGWTREKEACEADEDSAQLRMRVEQKLLSALHEHAASETAHRMLCEHHLEEHRRAERRGERPAMRRAELFLRGAIEHPAMAGHAWLAPITSYLDGDASFPLEASAPNASATVFRYEARMRHVVAEPWLERIELPATLTLKPGSYLATVSAPGHSTVRYPFVIRRGEEPDIVGPTGRAGIVELPRNGTLFDDELYVPAGWFHAGGDPDADGAFPRRRYWLEGFAMQRYPVDNRSYIEFLNALEQEGRQEEAQRAAPADWSGQDERGSTIYGRDENGRWFLRPDPDGDEWALDWPVVMIDVASAVRFARWLSRERRTTYRFPAELEWEKAGRGVDERFFPWGDGFDATWCSMRDSFQKRIVIGGSADFPMDESPYGVRHLAGAVSEWCAESYVLEPPREQTPPRLGLDAMLAQKDLRLVGRGGNWAVTASRCRLAQRGISTSTRGLFNHGFRLVRSLSDG